MKLRIHHFFDILRDYGRKEAIKPHPYGHSYHKVARDIWNNPCLKIRIIVACDDICDGCIHLMNNLCDDIIDYRKDFTQKEKFNDFIDHRIMKICLIDHNDVFNPVQLCKKAKLYLENILWIYEGNDSEHTLSRKKNVIIGLNEYSGKHKFDIL